MACVRDGGHAVGVSFGDDALYGLRGTCGLEEEAIYDMRGTYSFEDDSVHGVHERDPTAFAAAPWTPCTSVPSTRVQRGRPQSARWCPGLRALLCP